MDASREISIHILRDVALEILRVERCRIHDFTLNHHIGLRVIRCTVRGICRMKAKGSRLVLITDALRSAGMPDGTYENGGQTFVLRGIECRLTDGTIAGSVLRLNHAVRNLGDFGHIPLYAAVRAASLSAAESARLETRKGSLAPGKDADIVLMDNECGVRMTIVRGVCKYRKDI